MEVATFAGAGLEGETGLEICRQEPQLSHLLSRGHKIPLVTLLYINTTQLRRKNVLTFHRPF